MSPLRSAPAALTISLLFLASPPTPAQAGRQATYRHLDCGFEEDASATREYIRKVRSGQIPRRSIPRVAPRVSAGGGLVTADDLFLYEDTNSLLLTDFSNGDLISLMADAANALLIAHGDNFDFVGFWLNFAPHHTIGAAFYKLIENDVLGIGDVGAPIGEPTLFNIRPDLGLVGDNVEGFIMMWDVTSSQWAPGNGPSARFTRTTLGQEFEHRFALFLPPLLDGRDMQGDYANCGRGFHWNWQIDGQGSSMEISEWVGVSPAVLVGTGANFNTDIPNSVYSYTDLYLMGYLTPAEMDAGNSELRFMEGSDCSSDFFGTISTFSSADIIASAGPRFPDSTAEDKDYRTGWVMFHLPGQAPTVTQLNKTAGILNQFTIDWAVSTLERGSMDNTLGGGPVIPTLGSWGLPVLAVLLAGTAILILRRRRYACGVSQP